MSGLLIQHARWQEELVTPDDTRFEAGAKCGCICIECGEPLILRRGEKKRWHFAHRAETSCGGETYIHKVVKAWITEKLIGQVIPLPPHPELDRPQRFCVEKGWQEEHCEETNRIYDVILEGMFLYEKAEREKRGRLIFEVYYSNAKDDDFKLQTQKEGSYILEVNAKEFYGDGRENLTVERLVENSDWIWFTENQKLWGYNLKKNVRKIVGDWIAKEIWIDEEIMDESVHSKEKPDPIRRGPFYHQIPFGEDNDHIMDGPFKECGVGFYNGYFEREVPFYFSVEKCWRNRYSQKTGRIYDIVFQGWFVGIFAKNSKRGHLIFQLVDHFNAHDDEFKLQTQKAKFCVLEVDIHGFFGDGLKPPTAERLMANSRWVW